jgi:hypothetical protein
MKSLSLPKRQPWIRRKTPGPLAVKPQRVNRQRSSPRRKKAGRKEEQGGSGIKGFTYSDTIPVLVDHHDAQEHAKCEEKEAIDIVFDGVADRDAESEQDHLGDSEERGPEYDISDRPTVFKRSEHENELGDDVDHSADQGPQDVDDPQGDGLSIAKSDILLEGGDGEEEPDAEDDQTRDPQELGW